MRYRKSIRLGKGLRLNVSKSGVSMGAGIPGLSVNVGRRGTYLNTGIPGTGIYNRQRLAGGASSTHRPAPGTREAERPVKVSFTLDDSGNPIFLDENDDLISDESLIRRIKRTDDYKNELRKLRESKQKQIAKATDDLITVFKHTPPTISKDEVRNWLGKLTLRQYTAKEYATPQPDAQDIEIELEAQARREIKSVLFWRNRPLREQFVEDRLRPAVQQAMAKWTTDRDAFVTEERLRRVEEDKRFLDAYKAKKSELESSLDGSVDFVESETERYLQSIQLPVDFAVQFEYSHPQATMKLDLDLPEIEDLPDSKAEVLASGKLSVKKKTIKDKNREYATCVLGLAFFFAGNIFNVSPAIARTVVSGYTQRLNRSTGHTDDQYVFTIAFDRPTYTDIKVSDIDPIEAVANFEHRMEMTKTFALKTINPM